MGLKALSACDMTIQRENGSRERFSCNDPQDFINKCYNYCRSLWKSKGKAVQDMYSNELQAKLQKFNPSDAFELGGLLIAPTQSFARTC